jgi:hypothetical protein
LLISEEDKTRNTIHWHKAININAILGRSSTAKQLHRVYLYTYR